MKKHCYDANILSFGNIQDDAERYKEMVEWVSSYRELNTKSSLRQQKPKVLCPICNSYLNLSDTYCVGDCCHRICYNCIKKHVQQEINSSNEYINCPCDQCECKLDNATRLFKDKIISSELKERYEKKMNDAYLKKNNYSHCPLCNGLLPPYDGPNKRHCKHCNDDYCYNCHEKWHEGFTCQQFANYKKMSPLLKELFVEGLKFIKNENDMALSNCIIQFNSMILNNCMSFQRFINSFKDIPCNHASDGFFAWHGSSEAGVKGICQEGFDPKRRSGQSYGIGEYFGVTAKDSGSYLKENSNHMILTFISSKQFNRICNNFCYVINNPLDWSYSYCLPLFIVSYRNHSEVDYVSKENYQN
ncbi:hypothetical protein ENUP19_0305G0008 [Entamoeba nuttalli]|uniref:RBR-type E3 ubiquitin transferase n=1 Tax=Entamoeba nuttalli TaxID=412467 RepID=A0ABQ0DVA6_9EUKA